MVGRGLASVPDKLHSADHLANGEETENLRNDNCGTSDLGGRGVADGGNRGLANDGDWVLDESGEERLESSEWSGKPVSMFLFG